MCCNFLRYSVFLMHTVQLTCWCLCWRCLIHEIWIIKAGFGAGACLKLLCHSVLSWRICCCLSFWKATLFVWFACALLCESRRELHHTQLWFRAQFDFNSQQRAWDKWYESSVIAKLFSANTLYLSVPAHHDSCVMWPWTLPPGFWNVDKTVIRLIVKFSSLWQIWSHIYCLTSLHN